MSLLGQGEPPNPDLFVESELFVAGAISALPPFDQYHPAYALPHARQALEALSEWVPSDNRQTADDGDIGPDVTL